MTSLSSLISVLLDTQPSFGQLAKRHIVLEVGDLMDKFAPLEIVTKSSIAWFGRFGVWFFVKGLVTTQKFNNKFTLAIPEQNTASY